MGRAALLLIALIALYPLPAMAYIDPGSGSAILGAIIGFFVAVGLALKSYGYKLKALFRGKVKQPPIDEPTPPPDS